MLKLEFNALFILQGFQTALGLLVGLLKTRMSMMQLVSVAEEAGLNFTWTA